MKCSNLVFIIGWRKNETGLQAIYSTLELCSGGQPGHTTPTVLCSEENARESYSGRAGPSIFVPSSVVQLDKLV